MNSTNKLKKLASNGHADAQIKLGDCYYWGMVQSKIVRKPWPGTERLPITGAMKPKTNYFRNILA